MNCKLLLYNINSAVDSTLKDNNNDTKAIGDSQNYKNQEIMKTYQKYNNDKENNTQGEKRHGKKGKKDDKCIIF